MSQITVYTKPACPQCNAVFRALDKMGKKYRKIDISTDPKPANTSWRSGTCRRPWSTPAPTTTSPDSVRIS
jgi:glutaredoxin-like protein NrdH